VIQCKYISIECTHFYASINIEIVKLRSFGEWIIQTENNNKTIVSNVYK